MTFALISKYQNTDSYKGGWIFFITYGCECDIYMKMMMQLMAARWKGNDSFKAFTYLIYSLNFFYFFIYMFPSTLQCGTYDQVSSMCLTHLYSTTPTTLYHFYQSWILTHFMLLLEMAQLTSRLSIPENRSTESKVIEDHEDLNVRIQELTIANVSNCLIGKINIIR